MSVYEYMRCRNVDLDDYLIIAGDMGCQAHRNELFHVMKRTPDTLCLKWVNRGYEKFTWYAEDKIWVRAPYPVREQLEDAIGRPFPEDVKKVCVVSNKEHLEKDYSQFVDSCDFVIRISKMENLDTHKVGSRTDMAVIACWQMYLTDFTHEQRRTDYIKTLPYIVFDLEDPSSAILFSKTEGIQHYAFIPHEVGNATIRFTTFSKALFLALNIFPEAQVYALADMDVRSRTNYEKHTLSREQEFIDVARATGKVIPIL